MQKDKPGHGGLCWDWGGGPWEGHTVNVANPVTLMSSLVG